MFSQKFTHTKSIPDINESIRLTEEAIQENAPLQADPTTSFLNLAKAYQLRYVVARSPVDLEKVILVARSALAVAAGEHPEKLELWGIKAFALGEKFSRSGQISDLEDAILAAKQTDYLAFTTGPVSGDSRWSGALGSLLGWKFPRTGASDSLDQAILATKEAVRVDKDDAIDIVILNVGTHRCDTLIIEHREIRSLKLTGLTWVDIFERAVRTRSPETLVWLWDAIVEPVLGALGFDVTPTGDADVTLVGMPKTPNTGSLWDVDDALCAAMAAKVYSMLFRSSLADRSVSDALHHATRSLRDDWVLGQGGIRPRNDEKERSDRDIAKETVLCRPSWVPCVHYGV